MEPIPDGLRPATYILFEDNAFRQVDHKVIAEGQALIYVNGREIAALMCSPHQLEELAIGFLRSEGFIQGMDDIAVLHVADNGQCVDVWLERGEFESPARPITTSGCGGGVTFDDLSHGREPLPTMRTIEAAQVCFLMKQLVQAADLYQEARGVHTAALSDGRELLLVAQDIARHNTIDRIWGQALRQGVATEGRILICTGRLSSEMLAKAAKMDTPIVISRTSPTSLSVELGRAWNITVIGYARGDRFRIYSAPERVVLAR